jgi:uncharacterized protein
VPHVGHVARAFRIDAGTLRSPVRTPQGFLRADGYASRIGVFEYRNADGSIRRELRLPEEVFRADALGGFEGAPLTDGHPPEMVTAKNVKRYEVGTVTAPARRDGDYVATTIVIKDASVIAKLERGDTGLSVGYEVDLDETPGTHPQFGRYDAIQRNLVINHLAVGVVPRAGATARVRMDGAAVQIDPPKASGEGVPNMTDPTDKQRADELEGQAKALRDRITELEALVAANATAAESDAVKAEKARADAAEEKVARFDATFRAAVQSRAKLEREACSVLGESVRLDDMTDRQIHEAVVTRLDASADVKSANDDMLRGQYSVLIARSVANAASQARVSEILGRGHTEKRLDHEDERQKRMDAHRNQWRNQLAQKGA